ncbi:olfactory receptor 1f45-like [Lissotriton helveticus]
MEIRNQSSATEFILLGFPVHPEKQLLLFFIFLTIYTVTLLGNLTIFIIIRMDSRLHTPMYFFLSILAWVDVGFTTVTVPKLLADLLSVKGTISFSACITQLFLFLAFGNMDTFMLAVMGGDRYMAICHPLHYAQIMTKRFCAVTVSCTWVIASLHSALHSGLAAKLIYCDSNKIQHYFCDLPALLKLSCSDISLNVLVLSTESTAAAVSPLLCILISYGHIIIVIMRIKSSQGRKKAFSTCFSHITSTVIFFSPIIFIYLRPSSVISLDKGIWISITYCMLTSMLNPFVYSVRNNDVKEAFKKFRGTLTGSQ